MLVGGQAVNYWAEHYLGAEPALHEYMPFTSGDIDFRGNREDVRHIADQLKLPPVFPDKVSVTALAGLIPIQVGKQRSNIEIVRLIPGVAVTGVDELAVEAVFNGQQIRVLNPISLLLCKVNLALTVPQENRQDVEHLRMLFFCVRSFLRNFLLLVEQGVLPAKGWLGAVNKLSKLARSTHGRTVSKQFAIRWLEILPLSEIAKAKNGKIISFREQQLTRCFGSLNSVSEK